MKSDKTRTISPNRGIQAYRSRISISRSCAIQEYTIDVRHPISKHKIVDTIYTMVFDTRVFFDNSNDWYDTMEGDKMWAMFKA